MRPTSEVLILAAQRLPQGSYGGSLAGQGAVPLGQTVVDALTGCLLYTSPSPRDS